MTKHIGAFAAEAACYVAGTSAVCGSEWACDEANSQMTLNADGLYEKTYADVPAGDHVFKVTDDTWTSSRGNNGNNYEFTTTEAQNVTITFGADTKTVDA